MEFNSALNDPKRVDTPKNQPAKPTNQQKIIERSCHSHS